MPSGTELNYRSNFLYYKELLPSKGIKLALKILIAEDEPEILKLYKILLTDKGYQILATKDGQECLSAYRSELNKSDSSTPFDLVILDYRMPRKNGVEVAKEIMALRPAQRLLMVTAYRAQLDLQDQELKRMHIIEKPFDADELLATVSQLVNRSTASIAE